MLLIALAVGPRVQDHDTPTTQCGSTRSRGAARRPRDTRPGEQSLTGNSADQTRATGASASARLVRPGVDGEVESAYLRPVRIVRVLMAVDEPAQMAAFYNEVFGCGLVEQADSPLLAGSLAGTAFLLCPNEVAGVVAEQNRHQFRLAVADPESVARSAVAAGGSIVNRAGSGGTLVIGIADPEGNTTELVGDMSSSSDDR